MRAKNTICILSLFLLVSVTPKALVAGSATYQVQQYSQNGIPEKISLPLLKLFGVGDYVWGNQTGHFTYDPQRRLFIFRDGPLRSWGIARLNEDTSITFDFKGSNFAPVHVVMVRKRGWTLCPVYPIC